VFLAGHRDQMQAIVLGLGAGALIAAIALGVVLTYRGSGTVNFAAGAIAMLAGYVYRGLNVDGKLLLPPLPNPLAPIEGLLHRTGWEGDLPHWPTAITLAHRHTTTSPLGITLRGEALGALPAFLITVLYGGLLGLVVYVLVFRPLRHAPELANVVASVGLLVVLQAWVVLRYTSQAIAVNEILTNHPIELTKGIVVQGDQLLLAVVVIAAAAVLWFVFKFTRFGLAARAAAGNEKGAVLLGLSPGLLGGVTWVVSSMLIAALGILAASVNKTVDPVTMSLLIVPALAAALLGGFTSFTVTTVAAFGIAMAQSWLLLLSTQSWFPKSDGGALPGVQQTLPFLVIVVALFVRGKALPERGALRRVSLPFAPRPTRILTKALIVSAVAIVGLLALGPDWRLGITNTIIGGLLCLSLVVVTGYVGQISLAQMTIAGVAGFALAKLANSLGIPFPFAPILGALIAVVFGLVVAVPALRVRGVALAVVTFAMAVAVEQVVFGNPAWAGGQGGAPVPSPSIFGLGFGPNDKTFLNTGKLPDPMFGIVCLAVFVGLAVVVAHVRRGGPGRRMLAVRSNEQAAATAGISVTGTKLAGFAFAAFIAGIGGVLSGYRFGSVSAAYFGSIASLQLLAIAYLGGITTITGAVIGGLIVTNGVAAVALQDWFSIDPQYTLLLAGIGMIATAVLNPAGIAGGLRQTAAQLARRRAPPGGTSPHADESAQLAGAERGGVVAAGLDG
jgi:branched-chain amino acid transport system permease protein